MSDKKSVEIRVSVDVGYRRHSVAIGLPSGEVLEEFEIAHRPEGFAGVFYSHRETSKELENCAVAVAMEGFNGYARPLDAMVRRHGYRLYNHQQFKVGSIQGDLSWSSQERSDRCAQRIGAVSAKRSSAVGQGSVAGSQGNATGERGSQATHPAPAQITPQRYYHHNHTRRD